MSIKEQEVLASVRLLVAVAKADGVMHDAEKKEIEGALEGLELPDGVSADSLLAEDIDVDAEVANLESAAAKKEAYRSAYSLAYADGECSKEEQQLLESLRTKLGIDEKDATIVKRLFADTRDMVLPNAIQPIADPEKRAIEVRNDTIKYSVLSAVLGAFPVPGLAIATDLAVVGLQVKLIRDIGQFWGHHIDGRAARSMLYGLGLGTGARVAINNLVKFVPGWGSAFGAATSFAATFALGKLFDKFFADNRDFDAKNFDAAKLKDEFKEAEKEGKKAFKDHKKDIDDKGKEAKAKLDDLGKKLEAGEISQAEYEEQAEQLA